MRFPANRPNMTGIQADAAEMRGTHSVRNASRVSSSPHSHFFGAATMGQNLLSIQILSVPDFPHVGQVRALLEGCLQYAQIDTAVEEVVGDYNSPTLLVNGFDVTGSAVPNEQISCRLDLPNEQEIFAGNGPSVDRLLWLIWKSYPLKLIPGPFLHKHASWISFIYKSANLQSQVATEHAYRLHESGVLRLDSDQFIVAVAGLSITPTKHEMFIEGWRFWAWCALDVLGIFGVLNASGFSTSHELETDNPIHIEFIKGAPQQADKTMISLTDASHIASVCSDWCPNINFFCL